MPTRGGLTRRTTPGKVAGTVGGTDLIGKDLPTVKRDERDAELGRIAHDLSNLLAAIRSFATVIGEDLHDDPVVRADLEQIFKAVDEGVTLARRLAAMGDQTRLPK